MANGIASISTTAAPASTGPAARVSVWEDGVGTSSIAIVLAESMVWARVDPVGSADELYAQVVACPPDLVVVAMRGADGPGPAVIERLHRIDPTVPILAVTAKADAAAMSRAVAAGADGFAILDREGTDAAAIRRTIGRPGAIPPAFQRRPPATLAVTDRELQILRGMTDGYSNLEIARQLFVSEDTVKTHARRLFRKLGANDRAHAVALGMRYELVG